MGGEGKDFTNGGANANETFGGAGDDFIMLGQSLDAAFGDSGDDWEEGGDQPDLMQGDSGNLFFLDDSQTPGSDILIGQGGDDDYDMEGGDDIGVAGPGIEKVAGASGYDWEIAGARVRATHRPGPGPRPADRAAGHPAGRRPGQVQRGRGPLRVASSTTRSAVTTSCRRQVGGGGFIGCDVLDQDGLDRITGLDELVPTLNTPLADVVAHSASRDCPILSGTNVWGDGNILLGGGGNDLIEGRGADDIIDGDRYLNVRLSVRTNPADAATEIGTTDLMEQPLPAGQHRRTLQEAVFAGDVDPGNIVLVREILSSPTAGDDTALFSGPRADYDVTFGDQPASRWRTPGGAATDGTDTLRGIERLKFSDTTIALLTPAAPAAPTATAGNASATVTFAAPVGNGGPAPSSFTIVATPAAVTPATPVVTVTGITAPGARVVTGLANGTAYTFQVQAVNEFGPGALSLASNAVTPTAPAAAGPSLVARGPAVGATGVAVGANVTGTFNVAMVRAGFTAGTAANPGTVVLRNAATNAFVPAAVTTTALTPTTARVWTLNPNANLAAGTTYTVTLAAGTPTTGIRSSSTGTPLAAPITWSFTTVAANPPPTVTARTPAAGATRVARGVNITATFSEAVVAGGVNTTSVTLRRVSNNALIAAPVTYNAGTRVMTMNPNANLVANTQYRVTLTGGGGAIRDLAGAPLATTTWTFTTGP